jgi:hypothetical protein
MCSTGDIENGYKILIGKPGRKRLQDKHKGEDCSKTDLKEIESQAVRNEPLNPIKIE